MQCLLYGLVGARGCVYTRWRCGGGCKRVSPAGILDSPFTWVRGGRESEEESAKRKCSEDHSETEQDALMVHLQLLFFSALFLEVLFPNVSQNKLGFTRREKPHGEHEHFYQAACAMGLILGPFLD